MSKQYRVKAFVFIRANDEREAEAAASVLLDAISDESEALIQTVIRPGSAKLFLEEKEKVLIKG